MEMARQLSLCCSADCEVAMDEVEVGQERVVVGADRIEPGAVRQREGALGGLASRTRTSRTAAGQGSAS